MKTLKKIVYALQHICVPVLLVLLACAYVLWLRLHRLCKYMCRIL